MFHWIRSLFGDTSIVTAVIWTPFTNQEQYTQIKNNLYEWRQQWKEQIQLSFTTIVPGHLYESKSTNQNSRKKLRVAVVITSDKNILDTLPARVKSRITPNLIPVWSLVANVKNDSYSIKGVEIQGSKHFEPGAEVYPCRQWSGDGYERPYVVGVQRETKKFVSVVFRSNRLENWRVELVENQILIFQLRHTVGGWMGDAKDKEEAQLLANIMNQRSNSLKS